jgi:hypothetical protein
MTRIKVENKASAELEAAAKRLPAALRKGVLRLAQASTGEIRSQIYSTFKGRTGGLAKSFREVFIKQTAIEVSARSFSDLVYAKIQDEGGTIHAKRKWLAIPIGRKVPLGKWPRDYGRGELILVGKEGLGLVLARIIGKGKKAKVDPLFALRRSVTLTGRGYVEKARGEVAKVADKIMADGIRVAIEKT